MGNLISDFNRVINRYVAAHNLFSGGCCYAAYVLAKYLERLGVQYTVVMYQYSQIIDVNDFTQAINGSGVAHVAIEVNVNGKSKIIGSVRGIKIFFRDEGYEYTVRRYESISPSMLLEGYTSKLLIGGWNHVYDRSYNPVLNSELFNIFTKYAEQ